MSHEHLQTAAELRDILRRNGFRPCDAPACNCNSWHQVDGYAARFREIDEAVGDHNGQTLLAAVQERLAGLAAVTADRDAILRAAKYALEHLTETAESGHVRGSVGFQITDANARPYAQKVVAAINVLSEAIAQRQGGAS